MSKLNSEEKNVKKPKLSLNRETLRTLTSERLEEVRGGMSMPTTFSTLFGRDTGQSD